MHCTAGAIPMPDNKTRGLKQPPTLAHKHQMLLHLLASHYHMALCTASQVPFQCLTTRPGGLKQPPTLAHKHHAVALACFPLSHGSMHCITGAIPMPDNKTRGLKQPPNTEEERAKEVSEAG